MERSPCLKGSSDCQGNSSLRFSEHFGSYAVSHIPLLPSQGLTALAHVGWWVSRERQDWVSPACLTDGRDMLKGWSKSRANNSPAARHRLDINVCLREVSEEKQTHKKRSFSWNPISHQPFRTHISGFLPTQVSIYIYKVILFPYPSQL